jgi:hypothetical protein
MLRGDELAVDSLATSEGALRVCGVFRQSGGELICASHGKRGPVAEQRYAGRRIAEQRDPAP